jgi:hypothetical protein
VLSVLARQITGSQHQELRYWPMTRSKIFQTTLLLAIVTVGATVWPTLYRYDIVPMGNRTVLMRTYRLTGATEFLTDMRWTPAFESGPRPEGHQVPPDQVALIDGNAALDYRQSTFSGTFYNGSNWTLREVTVKVTANKKLSAAQAILYGPDAAQDFWNKPRPEQIKQLTALEPELQDESAADWDTALAELHSKAEQRGVFTEKGRGGPSKPPSPNGTKLLLWSREFRIPDLDIPPLAARSFSIPVSGSRNADDSEWNIVAAKGNR